MEIVSNEKKTTFDFRKCNIQFAKISYDISTGKTVSDLTGGVLTGDKYNKPLTEKLVLERLNSSVASLRYKIGGNYAPFPKNFQVNHLFNGQSVILEKTHIQSVELYLLCISDNYTVVYNDKTVLKLERERGWFIQTRYEFYKKHGYNYGCGYEKISFCLNDTDVEPLNLPLDFTLSRHSNSVAALTGVTDFNVISDTSPIEPTVFNGPIMDKNCHYCMLGYTDDYETDDFTFMSIRRWRVTH